MGSRMALNLQQSGYDVLVHDDSISAVERMTKEGMTAVGSPAELASKDCKSVQAPAVWIVQWKRCHQCGALCDYKARETFQVGHCGRCAMLAHACTSTAPACPCSSHSSSVEPNNSVMHISPNSAAVPPCRRGGCHHHHAAHN